MPRDNVKDWADHQAENIYRNILNNLSDSDLDKAEKEAIDLLARALRTVWDRAQPRDAIDL